MAAILVGNQEAERRKQVSVQQNSKTDCHKITLACRSFLNRDGKKLSGSMFVIDSTKAKEIESISVYPEEAETLFQENSHFRVLAFGNRFRE